MEKIEAAKVLNDLVLQVMATGGFKDFATLDKCREAVAIADKALKEEKK